MYQKKQGIKMNIIQCYISINHGHEDDKQKFYERLKSMVKKFLGKELLMLMWDLEATVEVDQIGYEDIMRWNEMRRITKSGGRFQINMSSTK